MQPPMHIEVVLMANTICAFRATSKLRLAVWIFWHWHLTVWLLKLISRVLGRLHDPANFQQTSTNSRVFWIHLL